MIKSYRIQGYTLLNQDTWLSMNEDGCVTLTCEDDHYSGKLSRSDSIALATDIICNSISVDIPNK